MGDLQGKYHVIIDGNSYVLARNRNRIPYYSKRKAPSFVNKFGSGDSSYRDATFWQFFAQTNWRNGSQQYKFDDPGKFWKSENINTNSLEKITLSKKLTSIGQTASGTEVNVLESWRSTQSWWDANYVYRQQLTVTASSSKLAPKGTPVKITIDTAALESASKLQADRDDWRVVYWNGSGWTDLKRDYVSTTITFFALQADIAAGASDTNYYVHYGYSGASTNQQPTTEDEWNEVYAMYRNGETSVQPDSNTVALYHFKEGSGTSVADDSDNANTGTASGSPAWVTTGLFGRAMTFDGSNDYLTVTHHSSLNLGTLTIEGWFKPNSPSAGGTFYYKNGTNANDGFVYTNSSQDLGFIGPKSDNGGGAEEAQGCFTNGAWQHFALTYNNAGTTKVYINGVEKSIVVVNGDVVNALTANSNNVQIGSEGGTQTFLKGDLQHMRVSNAVRTSFPYALGASEVPTVSAGTESTSQPATSNFDLYAGNNNGKVYQHDGDTTWTEVFDLRKLTWYDTETDQDTTARIGDDGGTEYATAQSFQLTAALTLKSVAAYLKKIEGTPGDISVRIETDSTGPSGTLAHANATATITAFSDTDFIWKEATFANSFSLSASTTYWMVLEMAAGANDNHYVWGADAGGGYSSGAKRGSADGGSTWGAESGDTLFRILGDATEVNCSIVTEVGGTQKMLFGVGDPASEVNGEARIYSYDGTAWALNKIFATANSSQVLSVAEFDDAGTDKLFVGVGPEAVIYESSDISTYTSAKDIKKPQNPGYPYKLIEYNRFLYAMGGSPEYIHDKHYNGFVYVYDTTQWNNLYPFTFTVIRSAEFYDAYLFIGTYHGQLFVYDTATLNPIFDFKELFDYQVTVKALYYFDDKLYIGLRPQENSGETNVGIWVYDRHGMSLAHHTSGIESYQCFCNLNNVLMVGAGDDGYVYKIDADNYAAQGFVQSSYFDANLPSINKLLSNVVVKHEVLQTGCDVKVYYRFKESDSWTLLGTSNEVGAEEKEMAFPTGVYTKKVTLKVELNTSDSTKTPTVTEVIMKYSLLPEIKWKWDFRVLAKESLKLRDRTASADDAATIRSNLEASLSGTQLVTFTDIDEVDYTVLLNDADESQLVVDPDTANENVISVSLIEA